MVRVRRIRPVRPRFSCDRSVLLRRARWAKRGKFGRSACGSTLWSGARGGRPETCGLTRRHLPLASRRLGRSADDHRNNGVMIMRKLSWYLLAPGAAVLLLSFAGCGRPGVIVEGAPRAQFVVRARAPRARVVVYAPSPPRARVVVYAPSPPRAQVIVRAPSPPPARIVVRAPAGPRVIFGRGRRGRGRHLGRRGND